MNARILRKWSIHTKNLMSCSVCSLVVVVLLLFVICAPTLILATMNFRSDASFAANLTHMPKNVIKEATLSSSSSSSSTLLTSLLSSLPNINHRLASYGRMEVVKTPDSNRESFPGYYKNYHTDDTQPLSSQQIDYIRNSDDDDDDDGDSSSYSSRNRELLSANSKTRHKIIENKHQLYNNNDNLGYMLQSQRWPRHHTSTSSQQLPPSDVDAADGIYDGYNPHAAYSKVLHAKNGNDHLQIPSSFLNNYSITTTTRTTITTTNHNFPVQQHFYTNRRETENRTHHVAPPPLLSLHLKKTPTKTLLQLQRTSRTATALPSASPSAPAASTLTSVHLKQPELIHNSKINNFRNVKNIKSIFSIAHNKSVAQVPVPVLKEDNVFDIDNSNVNKIKSSLLPLRFIIEAYEVPASLPLKRELTEQQRRMLIHEQHLRQLRTMQQQAARSRRESLRGRYKKYQNDLQTASSLSSSSSSAAVSSSSSSSSSSSTSLLSATKNLRKSPSFHNLRQHQHQNQHQHQQRMHKHSRRYCSARDPAQLAFEAPTVFEGKIVSMTPDRRQNFSATVEVREVFKQQIGYRLQKYLRLQFAYRNNSGECDIYREELRSRGLIRGDTIEPGRLYFLFVQQIDIGNFTILGQPIRKTKRVVEAVRYAVSGNYAQLASIKSISASNRSVENGQELRIICKVTGRPPPKVTWFKDHRSINRNRKLYQFSHYKKRSELIIRSFNTSDAGRYECRAKNKVNRNIERRAIVIKAYPVQRFDPNPRGAGNSCPDDASEFCFNGGTCKFFSEIGSYSCICPEGFIGERCDRKEVNNMPPSTYSNEHECGENKYLGSYYC